MKFFNHNRSWAWLAALISVLVYATTMARQVIELDAGELAAVAWTGGIAHPTGYPLFSVLTWTFTRIPFGVSPIILINFFSTICCAIGVYFFTLFSIGLLKEVSLAPKLAPKKKGPTQSPEPQGKQIINQICGFSAGLMMAFCLTWWQQSASIEVYSLHIALLALFLYVLGKAIFIPSNINAKKAWLFFAMVMALGFSNHLTFLMVIPGLAILYFLFLGFNTYSISNVARMALVFFSILSLMYSFLPIRAAFEPLFCWGNPENWENFFRHVSGFQFRIWMFAGGKVAGKNIGVFFQDFLVQFGYIGLLLGGLGLFSLFNLSKKVLAFVLVNILFTLFWAVNYDIKDIQTYFLYAYVNVGILIAFGMKWVAEKVIQQNSFERAIWFFPVVALFPLVFNYADANLSKRKFIDQYVRQVLASLPQDALLITGQWDFIVSPAYYLQHVEGLRKDVKIVDKELLRRSWYYVQLERNMPEVMQGVKPEIAGFLTAVQPFEQDKPYDQRALPDAFDKIIYRIIETNLANRSLFVGPEITQDKEVRLPPNLMYIPDRYLFRIETNVKYFEINGAGSQFDYPEKKDYYSRFVQDIVVKMKVNRAVYEQAFGKTDRAIQLRNEAISLNPAVKIPESLSGI